MVNFCMIQNYTISKSRAIPENRGIGRYNFYSQKHRISGIYRFVFPFYFCLYAAARMIVVKIAVTHDGKEYEQKN